MRQLVRITVRRDGGEPQGRHPRPVLSLPDDTSLGDSSNTITSSESSTRGTGRHPGSSPDVVAVESATRITSRPAAGSTSMDAGRNDRTEDFEHRIGFDGPVHRRRVVARASSGPAMSDLVQGWNMAATRAHELPRRQRRCPQRKSCEEGFTRQAQSRQHGAPRRPSGFERPANRPSPARSRARGTSARDPRSQHPRGSPMTGDYPLVHVP